MAADSPSQLPGENLRTIASLLIFVHLFSVFVVLSSNLAPSRTQGQLVRLLAPYTRTLNFDPNFAPFHLTTGDPIDSFHYLEVETDTGQTLRLPAGGWRGGFRYRRPTAIAHAIALFAAGEVDQTSAELARAVGDCVLAETGAARTVVRCIRQAGPARDDQGPLPAGRDDTAAARQYRSTVYEADVWRDNTGAVQVLKRSAAGQVAPPDEGA